MSKLTKKIVVGIVAFSLAFTAFGFALAEEDLQGEVESLEQMLADIQAQIAAMTGGETEEETTTTTTGGITGVPAGFSFNQNLSQGATGDAVKYLQIVLNSNADTKVAESGPGSPGNETTYFGPVTKAAVTTFQNKYASEVLAPVGLSAGTGFVGAQTRAKLNSILSAGGGTGTTPTTPTNQFSEILEQLAAIAAAVESLSSRVDDIESGVTPDGEEGELSVEARATVRSAEVKSGETKDVAVFRLEADNSPITVQRMDVYFGNGTLLNSTTGVTATDIRSLLDNMAIYVGGEKVAEQVLSRATVERDAEYIRFSGLNIQIPKDGYKDVTIEVTGADTDSTKTIYVGFKDDAIRGVDGVGLTIYSGTTAVSRSFAFVGEETGSIEARRHSSNPEEGLVLVSDTTNTEVELLRFNLTAKDSNIELDTLVVTLAGTAVTAVQDLVLYDGNTEIASVSASVGTNDFNDLNLDLVKGSTKTFRVVADVLSMEVDDTYHGKGVVASLLKTNNNDIAYDALDNEVGIDRDINGYAQAFYSVAPYATLKSSSNVVSGDKPSQLASAELVIRVTALGGDVYMIRESETDATEDAPMNVVDESTTTATGWFTLYDFSNLDQEDVVVTSTASGALATGTYDMYRITLDDTKEISVNATTSEGGWQKLEMNEIFWYAEKDGVYYRYEFDKTMDDVDALETVSRFVNN